MSTLAFKLSCISLCGALESALAEIKHYYSTEYIELEIGRPVDSRCE